MRAGCVCVIMTTMMMMMIMMSIRMMGDNVVYVSAPVTGYNGVWLPPRYGEVGWDGRGILDITLSLNPTQLLAWNARDRAEFLAVSSPIPAQQGATPSIRPSAVLRPLPPRPKFQPLPPVTGLGAATGFSRASFDL